MRKDSSEQRNEKFKEKAEAFKNKFPNDDVCRNRLKDFKWPNGFVCLKCGHNEKYEHSKPNNRRIYTCKECKRQHSITSGTIFSGTQIKLTKWFYMIFLVVRKKRIKTTSMQKSIDIKHYKTAHQMRSKIERIVYKPDAYNQLAGLISKKRLNKVRDYWLQKSLLKQIKK